MNGDPTCWQIKGQETIRELKELMGISDEDAATLATARGAAAQQAAPLAVALYERLEQHAPSAEFLGQVARDDMLRQLALWFIDLFSGSYDGAYAQRRLDIGEAFVRAGLPVRYPLALVDVAMGYGELAAQQCPDPAKVLGSFRRALTLDVALLNQACEERQLAHLAEMVGGERLARRVVMGGV